MRTGARVRLKPRPGGDVWDLALAGRTATVQAVEETLEGERLLVVAVDDDPGAGLPGHRFFSAREEVEPLRVLVAGIGNVFLGDDGFGVALAERLPGRPLPGGGGVGGHRIPRLGVACA